ncbi:MAG: FecR domain-containing protein [candidate division Zixibacteria bacterium]|nr:FecR domain-containing protein [Candidatus Tariuqbacter arcticus]
MPKYFFLLLIILTVAANGAPIGGIHAVNKPAFRQPADGDSFQIAMEKELLGWGDSLKTGHNGFMGILFQDGSLVKMAGNTEIKLAVPQDETTLRTINMKFGDLWANIMRADKGFVVKTPSSVAAVKGTKFWIMVTPSGDSRLLCQEGLVDFLNTVSGERMFIAAGQMCYSGMDGRLEITDVHPEEEGGEEPSPEYVPHPEPEGGEPEGPLEPQGGPGGASPPPSQPSGVGGGPSWEMNGAVGAAAIYGVNYQYFSLRPDISIRKFGIGLDLAFYFDSDGNIREEDWDEGGDYIDKIYYLRYGKPGEPFYIRAGSLSPITLGYGLIMKRYTNAIEWPQVRRIGMQAEVRRGTFKFEGLINNFRELDTPGLLGGRLTYETRLMLPLVIGGTLVVDGNQYLGVKDDDDDGVPNQWDMFPGKNDGNHIGELRDNLDPEDIEFLIGSGDLPDINNPPPNVSDWEEPFAEWGVDIGIPLIRTKSMNLWVYAQMAQIVDYGRGYAVPGVMFNLGPFRAGAEYRVFDSEFMAEFFDMAYETERVQWDEEEDTLITKEDRLDGLPSAQGYYAEVGLNLFDFMDIFGAYQNMSYGGGIPGESVYASGTLNTSFIPKVELAEAYYQQPNVDEIFSAKSDGTVIGYRVGIGMGAGVTLIYDNKTIYYNGEPNRIMTIETAISF